jgi:hypothetical protein
MPGTSPYILDRRATTEPDDSASFPFDRVEDNRVFEERAVAANMSVQGVKLNDWASRIISLEGGGGSGPTGDAVVFNTLTDVGANSIAADVDFIVVGGYADAGDCPPLPLRRVASEPIHEGKKQSADGAWWEYFPHGPIYLEWFGGKADYYIITRTGVDTGSSSVNPSPTDNRAAFYDAMEFIWAYGGTTIIAGPTIQLGYGSYYFSDELVFDRTLCLQGMGAGYYHDGANSRMIFAAGKRGIVLECFAEGVPGAGASHIRNVYMQCLGFGGQTTKHGIEMDVGSSVEHCTIRGFGGNGIDITADVALGQNANCFYLHHCVIYNNAGHGVYCSGGDSNAGMGSALNIASNGGWGIRDESFLGNCWIGCHEAYNEGGPYYMVGSNNRSVVIGCYNEGYHTASYCGPNTHFIGGTHASGVSVAREGSAWINNTVWPHYLETHESGDVLTVRLRGYNQANEVMSVTSADGHYTVSYDPTQKYLNVFNGIQVTDANTTVTGRRAETIHGNKAILTYGAWVGGDPQNPLSNLIHLGVNRHDSWGGIRANTYALNDTLLNANYSGGTQWADVCTTAGGVGSAWSAGLNYANWSSDRSTVIKNAGRYYRLVAETLGSETLSVDAPTHSSGDATGATDGHTWRYLTSTDAQFKRIGLMGAATVTTSSPIFDTTQTWNDAAVAFTGHKTNITSTASAATSMLEDWQVGSSTQANIRKDGRIAATASTAPVAGGAQTVQMTSTAGLGVYAGSGAPTVSAAKGSLYLRTNGSTTNDRMYVNTDGGTTWTAVTTAA